MSPDGSGALRRHGGDHLPALLAGVDAALRRGLASAGARVTRADLLPSSATGGTPRALRYEVEVAPGEDLSIKVDVDPVTRELDLSSSPGVLDRGEVPADAEAFAVTVVEDDLARVSGGYGPPTAFLSTATLLSALEAIGSERGEGSLLERVLEGVGRESDLGHIVRCVARGGDVSGERVVLVRDLFEDVRAGVPIGWAGRRSE